MARRHGAMTLLAPWTAAGLAALAVPALLLLWVLRLRRRMLRVPSTLLWSRRAVNLEANAPWARLRFSVLLLLQLLALLLLLLAAARPVLDVGGVGAGRIVVVIDRGATMEARDDPADERTRLAIARAEVIDLLRRTLAARGGAPREAMVIAAGATPEVVHGFDDDPDALARAIEGIAGSDAVTDLEAALRLADAFARPAGGERGREAETLVLLASDGAAAAGLPESGAALAGAAFRQVQPVPADARPRNLGIVEAAARRSPGDPETATLFLRVANAGPEPESVLVALERDGVPVAGRTLQVPAATPEGPPGSATCAFDVAAPDRAVLGARLEVRDALPADDVAVLLLPAPRAPSLLLVHPDDSGPEPLLRELLEVLGPRALRSIAAATWAEDPLGAAGSADLVVFDRVAVPPPASRSSIHVGAVPPPLEALPARREGGKRLLAWERDDPLLRHVVLDRLVWTDFGAVRAAPGWRTLAEGPDGPVIGLLETGATGHLVVGFELPASNWPAQVGLPVFLRNALDALAGTGMGVAGRSVRPGAAVTVRAAPEAQELRVGGASGTAVPLRTPPFATITAPERVGLHAIEGAAPEDALLAVALLEARASDLRPRAVPVVARGAGDRRFDVAEGRPIGRWLVAAALVLLALEWAWYLHRVRAGG